MAETWYKDECPKCETINWVCDGDISDLSGIDISGIKCRKCGHIWYLGEDCLEDIEDINWELGKEKPN